MTFERFTDEARRIVTRAQEEARVLNNNFVAPEHVLLALTADDAIAAALPRMFGISRQTTLQRLVDRVLEYGEGEVPPGHIPFTPRTKKIFELSLPEALKLGKPYVSTEHILLALAREGTLLERLDIDPDHVRRNAVWSLHESKKTLDEITRNHDLLFCGAFEKRSRRSFPGITFPQRTKLTLARLIAESRGVNLTAEEGAKILMQIDDLFTAVKGCVRD